MSIVAVPTMQYMVNAILVQSFSIAVTVVKCFIIFPLLIWLDLFILMRLCVLQSDQLALALHVCIVGLLLCMSVASGLLIINNCKGKFSLQLILRITQIYFVSHVASFLHKYQICLIKFLFIILEMKTKHKFHH